MRVGWYNPAVMIKLAKAMNAHLGVIVSVVTGCPLLMGGCGAGGDAAAEPGSSGTGTGTGGSGASIGGSGGLGGGQGGGGVAPVVCDDTPTVSYGPSGLPLVESNPGAPIALFIDMDGGTYHSHSSDTYTDYTGYNRNGSPDTFDEEEQADILQCFDYMTQYFAMFDVNVTTDDAKRQTAVGWGWILITEEESGGKGSLGSTAIGQEPHARAYAGASTVRSSDRCRRVAHELGHNFQLEHSGVWEGSTFYKWEDWPDWDGVYGAIMGGGGKGQRNGWSFGQHEGDPNGMQDAMAIIRQRVIDVGGSALGWREDDFPDTTAAPLCDDGTTLYRKAFSATRVTSTSSRTPTMGAPSSSQSRSQVCRRRWCVSTCWMETTTWSGRQVHRTSPSASIASGWRAKEATRRSAPMSSRCSDLDNRREGRCSSSASRRRRWSKGALTGS